MAARSVGVMLLRDLPHGQVLDYARQAEAVGFDELWVVEDLGFRGGVAQAAAVLAATKSITVGIGILPAAIRNPVFAAMEIATLGQLFPGRVTIGVGHGMPDWMRSVGALPDSPLTLLGEHLTAIRALLRGETVTTRGRYVTLTEARLEPSSLPEVVPPVLAGVRGPKSLALSGRVADGTVLAEPCTPEYVRASVGTIAATPHSVVTYNAASVHPDTATAVAEVRPGLAWIGEPDWAPHLAPLPFAAEFAQLRASCATREEFAERIPQEWVTQLALAGTPDEVRARNAELFDAGVTTSVLIPAAADPLAALPALASAR
ncbi:Flavin-dependent oxidoreductase, luciferase family (includes alkanesulfonate monooxygenase SsuD and methylene tetrahydromethanopterin reductase) [Actinosynnema pretiosum]|nr:Flavin-dependent oxidoreductase, luciferase family (includes alkanesulfonate monooxygenase SsuD and methylene tetrahydromethanopterin reductase) [Actinosynnema pretiosum]